MDDVTIRLYATNKRNHNGVTLIRRYPYRYLGLCYGRQNIMIDGVKDIRSYKLHVS